MTYHVSVTDGWEGDALPFESLVEARAFLLKEVCGWVNATGIPVYSCGEDSFASLWIPSDYCWVEPMAFYITHTG